MASDNGSEVTPSTSTTTAPASPAAPPASFPVDAPPQVTVPPVPAGFVPVNALDLLGWRPMQSELASVPGVVTELDDFPDYTALLGVTAPPASQVSARLTVAAEWTTLLAAATAWCTYVKSQEGMAWKDALALVDKLKTPFRLVAATRPALAGQYPNLARMLGAKSLAAKRGNPKRARTRLASKVGPGLSS
jgi:hypothetical protein